MPDQLLHQQLGSDDRSTQRRALERLIHSPETAASVLPQLLSLVDPADDTEHECCELATAVLENCGPPPPELTCELQSWLNHADSTITHPNRAYWAVTLIGRLGSAGRSCVSTLAEIALTHTNLPLAQRAVWALGRMADDSTEAAQVLRQCLASKDRTAVAVAAQWVMKTR